MVAERQLPDLEKDMDLGARIDTVGINEREPGDLELEFVVNARLDKGFSGSWSMALQTVDTPRVRVLDCSSCPRPC